MSCGGLIFTAQAPALKTLEPRRSAQRSKLWNVRDRHGAGSAGILAGTGHRARYGRHRRYVQHRAMHGIAFTTAQAPALHLSWLNVVRYLNTVFSHCPRCKLVPRDDTTGDTVDICISKTPQLICGGKAAYT
jgi:hypothetical protein